METTHRISIDRLMRADASQEMVKHVQGDFFIYKKTIDSILLELKFVLRREEATDKDLEDSQKKFLKSDRELQPMLDNFAQTHNTLQSVYDRMRVMYDGYALTGPTQDLDRHESEMRTRLFRISNMMPAQGIHARIPLSG